MKASKLVNWASGPEAKKRPRRAGKAGARAGGGGERVDFIEYADGRFSDLVPLLEEHALAVEDRAADLELAPQDVFDELPPDEELVSDLKDGFEELDEDLQEALAVLGGSSVEDAKELSGHLVSNGLVQEEDAIAAWLCLVGSEVFGAVREPSGLGDEPEDLDLEV